MAIYRILEKSGFGPDEIRRMTDAYEAALVQLGLARNDPLTEIIARHIIEIAQTGEKDSARICAQAILRSRQDVDDRAQQLDDDIAIPIPQDSASAEKTLVR